MRKRECWKCSDWLRGQESKWGLVNEDTRQSTQQLEAFVDVRPSSVIHFVSLSYFVDTHFRVFEKPAFLKL